MEVRPLQQQQQQQQQQRHPPAQSLPARHPQHQQQHMPPLHHHSSPDTRPQRLLPQQLQPPQAAQHPPHVQQPHHVMPLAPRSTDPTAPLVGEKRDSSGTPHSVPQPSGAIEYKLFVGSLSKLATEKDIEEVFAPYGRVDDVYIIRDDQRQSKGCAFVKFPTREMAVEAISALNSVYKMPGCDQPMIVRFADPKRPRSGDTRVGGPGFGGSGFSPRSGMGPRPSSFTGGIFGVRSPYWRPVGGPVTGAPQGGVRPYGTQNASRGPPHEGFHPLGFNQPSLQRQAQGYEQQQHQASQPPLAPSNQEQQSNHQSQLQPVQASQQAYSQVSEQRSQQQATYGQFPSAQMSIQPYAQLSASQTQMQQQVMFSEQQTASSLHTQQASPMVLMQQTQHPTFQQQPFSYSVQPSPSLTQHHQQQQLSQPFLQQQQHQLLSVQPLSTQLQPLTGQLQQPVTQQLVQDQQHQQPAPTRQSLNQSLQTIQAAQQAYFQTTPQAVQTQVSVQPSWSVPLQQHVASTVIAASAPATTAIMVPAVTCNWSEHVSPEGHKYYYNSVTGESRWEKPDEFAAYEQQQQRPQQQTSIQQQYASSATATATATQQTLQALGYAQLQPERAMLDPSRTSQQLAPTLQLPSAQQALPSVQDWTWKMKPANP